VSVGSTRGGMVSSRCAWSALAMASAGTRTSRWRAAADPSQRGQGALQVGVPRAAAIALVVRINIVARRAVAWDRRARARVAEPPPASRLARICPRLVVAYPRAAAFAAPRARSAHLVQRRFSAVAGDAGRRPRRADHCRHQLLRQVDGRERRRTPCRRSWRVASWLRRGRCGRCQCIAGRCRSRQRGSGRGRSGSGRGRSGSGRGRSGRSGRSGRGRGRCGRGWRGHERSGCKRSSW